MEQKTLRYISTVRLRRISLAVLCMLLLPFGANAQDVENKRKIDAQYEAERAKDIIADSIANAKEDSLIRNNNGKPMPTQYIPTEKDMKQTFFQGFTVSADLLNTGLYFLSSIGSLEAALRLNLLNTYFPILEVGLGKCDKSDYNTKVGYSTNAPFMRVGIDYNVLKDKWQSNKLFVGARYGITNYNYSISGPEQTDPIWGGSEDFDVNSINATSHFVEFVFGCQVKVWSFVHMGWSVRYKMELSTTKSNYSHPYYIPGYGTTVNSSYWGASYNLSFDLNWGKKKPTVKDVIQNQINNAQQQGVVQPTDNSQTGNK